MNQSERRAFKILQQYLPQINEIEFRKWCEQQEDRNIDSKQIVRKWMFSGVRIADEAYRELEEFLESKRTLEWK